MRFFASFLATALTFVSLTTARVANPQQDTSRNARRGLVNLVKDVFHLQPRQGVCVEDDIYEAVQNYSQAQVFCSKYLSLPAATVIVDYTPTVTDTSTYTTLTSTTTELVRTTPVITVTTTTTSGPVKLRREAGAADVEHFIRQELASSTSTSFGPAFSQQLSSACSCLPPIQLSTTTATYTADPTHVTELAHVNEIETITTTAVGRATTTTVTAVYAVPTSPTSTFGATGTSLTSSNSTSSSISTSSSSAAPTPISPTFTCPDENNVTISQLVGNQLYDYLLLCSTSLADTGLASYTYSTLDECAAACSRADNYFGFAICQAVVFDSTISSGLPNCFLKTSGNSTVSTSGSNAAILQRISLAVTNSTGTTSSSTAFASTSSTLSIDTSAAMSSIFANSSTSMPLITPAPTISGRIPGNVGVTSYSTFVSDGSTYSTGSVYSTYFSSNGVWYYSYYTSYTVAWVAATTIVGQAATTSVSSSENGGSSSSSGSGGGSSSQGNTGSVTTTNITSTYEIGGIEYRNVTIIVWTVYPNGQSNETETITIEQVGGAGGSGGAGSGGSSQSSGGSGTVTTVTTTVTEYNTTEIYNVTDTSGSSSGSGSSGSGGASGSGSPSSTLVYSSEYTTQFTSTFETSGGNGGLVGGASGATSTVSSGIFSPSSNGSTPVSNSPAFTTESVFSSAYSTEFSTIVYSTISTGGASGFVVSGQIGGSGTAASGIITPSNGSTATFTGLPRSGTASPLLSTIVTSAITSFASGTALSGATTPASPSSSVFVSTETGIAFSTAYSTVTSYGSSGASGTALSGAITPSTNISSPSLNTATDFVLSTGYSTVISTSYGSSGASGFVASGSIGGSGTAISGSFTPTINLTSSIPFSGTGLPRSGTASPSTTFPILSLSTGIFSGTPLSSINTSSPVETGISPSTGLIVSSGNSSMFSASFTGAPRSGTGSPTTLPSGTPSPSTNSLLATGPTGTATLPSNVTTPIGTGTGALRSGTASTLNTPTFNISSQITPTGSIPGSVPILTGTSPISPSFTGAPRSGTGSSSVPLPSGNSSATLAPTSPLSESPIPTYNSSSGAYTIPITTGLGLTGTSPRSSTGGLRTGTYETTGTSPTMSTGLGSLSSICSALAQATTTFWSTTTVYGCYTSCPVIGGGGGGYGQFGGYAHPTGV